LWKYRQFSTFRLLFRTIVGCHGGVNDDLDGALT
jgi:hypothetical protein